MKHLKEIQNLDYQDVLTKQINQPIPTIHCYKSYSSKVNIMTTITLRKSKSKAVTIMGQRNEWYEEEEDIDGEPGNDGNAEENVCTTKQRKCISQEEIKLQILTGSMRSATRA